MLTGEVELVSEWTGLPGRAINVKRFERSNGLDTARYKTYLFILQIAMKNWLLMLSCFMLVLHRFRCGAEHG